MGRLSGLVLGGGGEGELRESGLKSWEEEGRKKIIRTGWSAGETEDGVGGGGWW